MRLDKFLAQSLSGTRKIARKNIKEGIIKVNGHTITEPATEICETSDVVESLGKPVEYAEKIYYMFNKPRGCITATKDEDSKTVFDYFTGVDMKGVFHVGRLDKDTEGLLLFTNDGEFEHGLMHPKKHMYKTYFFWAFGSLDHNDMRMLEEGLYMGNDSTITKRAKLEIKDTGTYTEFKAIMAIDRLANIDSNKYDQPVVSGYLTICEGRKHQVKRMLKAVGCYVVYLNRISIGGLILDESLKKGEFRLLTQAEVLNLSSE